MRITLEYIQYQNQKYLYEVTMPNQIRLNSIEKRQLLKLDGKLFKAGEFLLNPKVELFVLIYS